MCFFLYYFLTNLCKYEFVCEKILIFFLSCLKEEKGWNTIRNLAKLCKCEIYNLAFPHVLSIQLFKINKFTCFRIDISLLSYIAIFHNLLLLQCTQSTKLFPCKMEQIHLDMILSQNTQMVDLSWNAICGH